MKINFISNINNIKYYCGSPVRSLNRLSSDVFVKTNPSFKSGETKKDLSGESFEKWALDSGYLQKVDKNPDNAKGKLLGSGFEGTVYEIPETDDWVIKELKRGNFVPKKRNGSGIRILEDIIPDMNVGQTIACLEIPCGPSYCIIFHIRKKQSGTELGIDPQNMEYSDKYSLKQHLNSLRLLAEAPQETFDGVVKNLCAINEAGYDIDCSNPNNFLYDKEKKQINFVDINDRRNSESTQTADVLYALLDTFYYSNLLTNGAKRETVEESKFYSDAILNKFFCSMKKYNQQLNKGNLLDKLLETDLTDSVLNASSKEDKIEKLAQLGLYTK